MKINIIDPRPIGIGVVANATWWNWTTLTFESPFNAANHIKPFTPAGVAPSDVASVQTVDLGQALLSAPGAGVCPFVMTDPPVPIDPASLSYLIPGPGSYGFWPAV